MGKGCKHRPQCVVDGSVGRRADSAGRKYRMAILGAPGSSSDAPLLLPPPFHFLHLPFLLLLFFLLLLLLTARTLLFSKYTKLIPPPPGPSFFSMSKRSSLDLCIAHSLSFTFQLRCYLFKEASLTTNFCFPLHFFFHLAFIFFTALNHSLK